MGEKETGGRERDRKGVFVRGKVQMNVSLCVCVCVCGHVCVGTK